MWRIFFHILRTLWKISFVISSEIILEFIVIDFTKGLYHILFLGAAIWNQLRLVENLEIINVNFLCILSFYRIMGPHLKDIFWENWIADRGFDLTRLVCHWYLWVTYWRMRRALSLFIWARLSYLLVPILRILNCRVCRWVRVVTGVPLRILWLVPGNSKIGLRGILIDLVG